MTNEELLAKIKAEIERLKENILSKVHHYPIHRIELLDDLLAFLSTLESEKPINPADAMKEIEEKIALVKQRGTWDGVDVDKYMDEVRGREPETPMQEGLDEEIESYWKENRPMSHAEYDRLAKCARHFAEWAYQQGIEKGKKQMTIRVYRFQPKESETFTTANDLEEAAKKYVTEWHENPDGSAWKPFFEVSTIKAFIAGWKAKEESEKPVPKDLDFEQELYNHFGQIKDFTLGMRIGQYFYNLGRDSVPLPEDTVLFNKGVEEGKRLMMEEAVEGIVCYGSKGAYIETDFLGEYDTDVYGNPGDKVRVIVVKE